MDSSRANDRPESGLKMNVAFNIPIVRIATGRLVPAIESIRNFRSINTRLRFNLKKGPPIGRKSCRRRITIVCLLGQWTATATQAAATRTLPAKSPLDNFERLRAKVLDFSLLSLSFALASEQPETSRSETRRRIETSFSYASLNFMADHQFSFNVIPL